MLSVSKRDSLPNLSRRHIVEQDDVDTLNFDEGTNLFQIIGLHFDTDVWSLLTKLANSVGKAGESLESQSDGYLSRAPCRTNRTGDSLRRRQPRRLFPMLADPGLFFGYPKF